MPSVSKIVLVLAVLAALATVAIYFNNWTAALSSPYSINFEAPILWAAEALSRGQNIYPHSGLVGEPWITTIYPPLYLLFCAGIVKAGGAQYFYLRAANMLFCAGTAILFYRILRGTGLRLFAALAGLLFFFSFDCVSNRSYEVRPDISTLFFCVFMLERFVAVSRSWDYSKSSIEQSKHRNNDTGAPVVKAEDLAKDRAADLGAGQATDHATDSTTGHVVDHTTDPATFSSCLPFLALAWISVGFKQQAVVFVLSVFLYLLAEKRAKLAGKLFAVWLSGLLLFTAAMQLLTGAYVENLSFLAAVKSSSQVLIANLGSLGADWIKLAVALPVVPCGLLAVKRLQGIQKLPFITVFVSTLLFLYSMGIPASSANHMVSALFALAWCLSISLDKLPAWVGVISLVACAAGFPSLSDEGRYRPLLLPHARKSAAELLTYNLRGKPVLTDDLYLNMLTGSQPVLVDCATFLNVWTARGADFSQLIKPIAEKRYAAVIINSVDSQMPATIVWWPRPVVAAIHANYHKIAELHCSGWNMDLYLPAAPP